MNTYISMLRGINVGGHTQVSMAALKDVYSTLGFKNIRTYLQSGNVLFECSALQTASLADAIEAGLKTALGMNIAVVLRTPGDYQRLIESNPFLHGRQADPASLHVTFLKQAPSDLQAGQRLAPPGSVDEYILLGQDVFLFCPNGYGKTRLSNAFFERKLGTPATTRNWKTVLALHHMVYGQAFR
jgi:uncharacterized protein (DUF1697 family)